MIHPCTELRLINAEIGYGVFATMKIPQGTVVWTLCEMDFIYTPLKIAALSSAYYPILCKYAYLTSTENIVLCWDHARYMNHSCAPNLRTLENCEIAVRDIAEGEQITCEYGVLNF